jgi:ribosomal protein S18 acetylase RimI-like enzyme
MHPLDNVIWNALNTRDQHFAESFGHARRFHRDVSPLAAFETADDNGYASLAGLLVQGDTVGLFLPEPYEARPGWERLGGGNLLQMIHEGDLETPSSPHELHPLGAADSPEMLELTALTKPGPFLKRTHHLGTYLGIRKEGKLVAMAGERLKVPGHTEVSAVCTHPDHLGQGYARILMTEVMRRIRERGETPYLHSIKENTRAIDLYKRLGFRERLLGHFVILRKQ